MSGVRVAVAKGRLLEPLVELFRTAGLVSPGFDLRDDSRRLLVEDEAAGLSFLLVKPADVPTYVEYGAADLGVVGKDVLWEAGRQVCELLDLGFGFCRLVAAEEAGVDEIYRMGGAQAIAALAYGTLTIPRVDKITGPGNVCVTLAVSSHVEWPWFS